MIETNKGGRQPMNGKCVPPRACGATGYVNACATRR